MSSNGCNKHYDLDDKQISLLAKTFCDEIISKNYKVYLDNENKTTLSEALDQMKVEIAQQALEFKTISEETIYRCRKMCEMRNLHGKLSGRRKGS